MQLTVNYIDMKAKEFFMYGLGAMIVLGFFALLIVLIFKPLQSDNKDLLNLSIGSLLAAFGTIVGYFYGSSKSSQEKTEIIAKSEPVNL